MKKSKILLTVLAFSMVLGLSIGSAMAYFTTFVTAKGGVIIKLGDNTTITEPEVTDWKKHIRIHNDGPESCYVRAKAYAASTVMDELKYIDNSKLWVPGNDGYWYYTEVLPAGPAIPDDGSLSRQELSKKMDNEPSYTKELQVGLEKIVPADAKEGDDFNVVVIYESIPVTYRKDGKPIPYNELDWSQAIIVDNNDVKGGNS